MFMFVKEITATVSSPAHTATFEQTASLTHIRIQIKRNAVNNVVKKIKRGPEKVEVGFCSDRD